MLAVRNRWSGPDKVSAGGYALAEFLIGMLIASSVMIGVGQWYRLYLRDTPVLSALSESEIQWRRCAVRLSRELHDAAGLAVEPGMLRWTDGAGRILSVRLNAQGQLLQSVDGAGAVVLANGVRKAEFREEGKGVWIRTWWTHPWTEEPVSLFVVPRRP
ncbi:MAG: hypothetical protein QJR06_03695 [Alicyclobacillaceae bacterium]|nr:hypothetical protein [Alicyclobacillaceae bacterium]